MSRFSRIQLPKSVSNFFKWFNVDTRTMNQMDASMANFPMVNSHVENLTLSQIIKISNFLQIPSTDLVQSIEVFLNE